LRANIGPLQLFVPPVGASTRPPKWSAQTISTAVPTLLSGVRTLLGRLDSGRVEQFNQTLSLSLVHRRSTASISARSPFEE